MNALWTAAEVLAATGGAGEDGWMAQGVSINTRTLKPGDLFIALEGEKFDGHDYVGDAFAKGAAACIVAREGVPSAAGPLVAVADTMGALYDLAAAARRRSDARVVAITGSVGKTSMKEGLAHILGTHAPVHASEGNLNNQWGLPLSLARLPASVRFAVFEIGMNHAGEIEPLSRLAKPHLALVTGVEATHIGHFAGLEDIARAKAEIFAGILPGGIAIVGADSAHGDLLREAAHRAGCDRILDYGFSGRDARVEMLHSDAGGSDIRLTVAGEQAEARLAVPGRHWAANAAGMALAAHALGMDLAAIVAALGGITPPPGRGRRLVVGRGAESFTLIDDAYNASPASMRAAIDVLSMTPPAPGGRRVLIAADMLELGAAGAALHRELAPLIADAAIDVVHTAGRLAGALRDALPEDLRGYHADDAQALAVRAKDLAAPGDVVLVKGSLGMGLAVVIEALKNRDAVADEAQGKGGGDAL